MNRSDPLEVLATWLHARAAALTRIAAASAGSLEHRPLGPRGRGWGWIAGACGAYLVALLAARWAPWYVMLGLAAIAGAGLIWRARLPVLAPRVVLAAGAWFPLHLLLAATGGAGSLLIPLAAAWLVAAALVMPFRGVAVVAGSATVLLLAADLWVAPSGWLPSIQSLLVMTAGLAAGWIVNAQRAAGSTGVDRLGQILREAARGRDGDAQAAARRISELEVALEEMRARFDADRAVFWDIDRYAGLATPRLVSGGPAPPRVRLTGDPLAWAWEEGLRMRVDRAPRWAPDTAGVVILPAGPAGRFVVTLDFGSEVPDPGDLADSADYLFALARLQDREAAAVASRERTRQVLDVLRRLPRELELEAFGRELATAATRICGGTGAAVAVWDEDAGQVVALVGDDGGPSVGMRFLPRESEMALAARSGATAVRDDRRTQKQLLPVATIGERWYAEPRCLVLVPMREPGERVVATLAVWNSSTARIPAESVAALETLAPYAALQFQHALEFGAARMHAQRDGLTNLENRRAFEDRLDWACAHFNRYRRPAALILLDIDHFHEINAVHGTEAGDAVLKAVGQTIRASLRDTDLPARFGGEEFAVYLPETGLRDACTAAERLRRRIERVEVRWQGAAIPVRASLGVSACPECVPDPVALVRSADTVLYAAKAAGRNRVSAAPADG